MVLQERQLRILGVQENVAAACEFVVEQARAAGMDEAGIQHCYLAVDEACTNIIEHGYHLKCEACTIDVFCHRDDHALTITIVDDGRAFNPLVRPDPDPKTPLNERGEGGWGIFFIKRLMDQVAYTFEDNRNRLVMVKKITGTAQPARTQETPVTRTIEISALSEKVWLITASGRLDEPQVSSLTSAVALQLELGHRWLILNLADVDMISSAGVKMMVSAWQRVRDQEGDLVLAALTPRVREVLEMIGLDLVFAISETTEQARAYLSARIK